MSISIANRILLGFAAVTVVLIALGLYATGQIGTVRETIDRIVTRDLMVMRQLDNLGNKVRDLGVQRRSAVISVLMREHGRAVPDEDSYLGWRRMAETADGLFADLLRESAEFRQGSVSPDRMAAWDRLNATLKQTLQTYNAYRDASEAQLKAVVAKDFEKVETSDNEVGRLYEATIAGIERTRSALDGSVAAGQRGVAEVYEFSRSSILLTLALAVLLSFFVTWAISRSVVRPVNEVAAFVERVGTGDLTGRIAVRSRDEIGRLGTTLNAMVGGLADLARTNRSATANLNAAAAEIRAS
ncbi:HAMP domain-containing protein, partial [Methylobacterium gnaphalii]